MNKTLLYVTAAAGLIASGAALADAANVEIYGTLNTDFENVKARGGTAAGTPVPASSMNATAPAPSNAASLGIVQPDRNRVTSNSSNIGFRGSEDLGMGLKAIFQIESGISIDSASTTTTTAGTASTGFWGSRNTNVGLASSKLGTIFYGNWDTPYKSLTNTAVFSSFYGTGIADVNAIIGTPGFNVATITTSQRNGNAGDASFDRRQGNSVQYWTPQFYGISGRLAYSANEQRSNEPTAGAGQNTNPNIYSASVTYVYGPFRAAYTFEQHRDYFGLTQLGGAAIGLTNTHARDNGNKATLGYTLPWAAGTTDLNVAFEQLAYNNSDTVAGNLNHYDRNMVYFAGKHQIGANTFRVGFGNAWSGNCDRAGGATPPACSATGHDAKQYSLGYSYSFSKRTDLYGFYTGVNNGGAATYQLGNGAGLGASAGNHSQGFGLGMRHVF